MKSPKLIAFLHGKVQEIKNAGYKVDCYSCKNLDGSRSGKATEDCDVAIDVYDFPKDLDFGQFETQVNPYGYSDEVVVSRLKYKVN